MLRYMVSMEICMKHRARWIFEISTLYTHSEAYLWRQLGIFPYFGSKMLKESLIHGHLLVVFVLSIDFILSISLCP